MKKIINEYLSKNQQDQYYKKEQIKINIFFTIIQPFLEIIIIEKMIRSQHKLHNDIVDCLKLNNEIITI